MPCWWCRVVSHDMVFLLFQNPQNPLSIYISREQPPSHVLSLVAFDVDFVGVKFYVISPNKYIYILYIYICLTCVLLYVLIKGCCDVGNTWPEKSPVSAAGFCGAGGPRAMFFLHHGKSWLKPFTNHHIDSLANHAVIKTRCDENNKKSGFAYIVNDQCKNSKILEIHCLIVWVISNHDMHFCNFHIKSIPIIALFNITCHELNNTLCCILFMIYVIKAQNHLNLDKRRYLQK